MNTQTKRYKLAVVTASRYSVPCPFKNCGVELAFDRGSREVGKGKLLECANCRKTFRIKKVVA